MSQIDEVREVVRPRGVGRKRDVALPALTAGVTVIGGSLVIGGGTPVEAASFVVANTNASGAGSLRQAILDANDETNFPGPDVITFAPGVVGTIDSAVELDIYSDITIIGPGENVLTLTNSTGTVLYLYGGGALDLSGVTIGGTSVTTGDDGIRAYAAAELTLTDVTISGNSGEGIEVRSVGATKSGLTGNLSISGSTITDNDSYAVMIYNSNGGAPAVVGSVSVVESSLTDNGRGGLVAWSSGTGRSVVGPVTVTDSHLDRNGFDGAYLGSVGTVSITRTTATGNSDNGVYITDVVGAVTITDLDALENSSNGIVLDGVTGNLLVTGSSFDDNLKNGGYLAEIAGTIVITDSSFHRNDEYGLEIDDAGDDVTIEGSSANENGDRGVSIYPVDGDVEITGGTFNGNDTEGVYFDRIYGNVTLSEVTVSGNAVGGGNDPGIEIHRVYGDVSIVGSTVIDNLYVGVRVAPLIYDGIGAENLDVIDTVISGNAGSGLLIVSYGDASLDNVGVTGDATITNSDISSNGSDGITLDGSTFGPDVVPAVGGTVVITESTVNDNGANGVTSRRSGAVTIDKSTLAGNGSTTVVAKNSDLTLSNSTLSGNAATDDSSVIYAGNSTFVVSNSTISGNGGPITNLPTIRANFSNGTVTNSVVTGNDNGGVASVDVSSSLEFTHSLLPVGASFDGTGVVKTDDPLLSPLGDFGGPTETMRPLPGSPAINAGDAAFVAPPLTDQRGVARVAGGRLDIGAVEFDGGAAAISPATVAAAENTSVEVTVTRTGAGDGAASVTVATVDGTAVAGVDFTAVTTTLSWVDGEVGSKTVSIALLRDTLDESGETFTVVLSNPLGVTLGDSVTTITITDVPPAIVPLAPVRLLDTRPGELTVDGVSAGTGRADAGQILRVKIAGRGGVPADAVGVVANVAAISPSAPGFATLYPCTTDVPTASNVNFFPGEVVANNSVVPLNAAGEICIFTLTSADYILDVNGYVPAGSPVTGIEPARYLDTRVSPTFDGASSGVGRLPAGGGTVEVQIAGRGAVPANAVAAVVNVTAIFPDGPGFLTLFPCGDRPEASTLNYFGDSVVPNGALTQLSPTGSVCVYSLVGADIALDVSGYVPAGVDSLVTRAPARLLDTRPGEKTVDGTSAGTGRLGAGTFVEVQVTGRAGVPTDATAAILNVGVVFPDGPGFVTLYPCGDLPTSSNLNHATGGVVRANNAITKLSPTGTVCVYTLSGADIILDIAGWLE